MRQAGLRIEADLALSGSHRRLARATEREDDVRRARYVALKDAP